MNTNKKIRMFLVVAFFLAAFFVPVSIGQAEDIVVDPIADSLSNEDIIIDDSGWPIINTPDTSICFDYYHFQSVQVSVGTSDGPYRSGDKVTFSGDLINQNEYPVVDGNLFVRIGRENQNYQADGRYIADEFFALEKITLDAKEQKAVEFFWTVPQGMVNGQYTVDYFFSVGKKFNLAGLPFSNEIIAGSTQFNVIDSATETIKIDRSQTMVNGEKYRHVGSWPRIAPGSKALIEQSIQNLTTENKKIDVSYDLYYWDSLDQGDKIDSKQESFQLSADAQQKLAYTIPAMQDSVYYLKITVVAGGQKSIVNVRLASEQNRPRLNYPAITKFPIKQGEKFSLFSCFHNTSGQNTEGKMTVILSDKENKEVGRVEYSGEIFSQMQADAKELIAERNLEYLKLSAEMRDQGGKLVDKYETIYDCQYFGKCQVSKNQNQKEVSVLEYIIWIFGGLTIVLILIILVVKRKRNSNGMGSGIGTMLLLFSLIGGVFFFSGGEAGAATTKTDTAASNYEHALGSSYAAALGRPVSSGSVTATHSVSMPKNNYNLLPGECVDFTWSSTASEVSFAASGGNWDTPYAYAGPLGTNNWRGISNTAGPTFAYMKNLVNSQYIQSITGNGANSGRITFTAAAPTVSMSSSNARVVCTGMQCCASATASDGPVRLTTNIAVTPVRIWSITQRNYADRTVCLNTGGSRLEKIGSCSLVTLTDGTTTWVQKFWSGEAWVEGTYVGGYSWLKQDAGALNNTMTMNLPTASIAWDMTVVIPVINGACTTPPNGNTQATAPTPSCTAGTASGLTTNADTWTWTCSGTNGGTTASCSANMAPSTNDFTWGDGTTNKILTLGSGNPTIRWTLANTDWCWATSSNLNNDFGWTNHPATDYLGLLDINGDRKVPSSGANTQSITPTSVGAYTYNLLCGNSSTGKNTGWKSVTLTVNPIDAPGFSTICPTESNSAVDITWAESGQGSGGYYVDIDNDNDWNNGYLSADFVPTGTLSFRKSNLTQNSTYYIRVYYVASGLHTSTVPFTANSCCPPPNCLIGGACVSPGTKSYACSQGVCGSGENCTSKANRCLVSSSNSCPSLTIVSPSVCRDNGESCEDSIACFCPNKNWVEVVP